MNSSFPSMLRSLTHFSLCSIRRSARSLSSSLTECTTEIAFASGERSTTATFGISDICPRFRFIRFRGETKDAFQPADLNSALKCGSGTSTRGFEQGVQRGYGNGRRTRGSDGRESRKLCGSVSPSRPLIRFIFRYFF